jgi:cation transporter-like permease
VSYDEADMANNQNQSHITSDFLPEIRRARFEKLTIYEVSDSELDILAKGSPDSTYLDFSIGLLSAAIAFSITLATTKIESNRTFTVFTIAVILGYLFGFLFLLLWWKNHTSVSTVVKSIRSRLPPEGMVLPINETILTIESVSIDENCPSKSD